MPTIPYNATDFPASYGPLLAGGNLLEVSWAQVVWAAVSVGKAQLQNLSQYGVYSAFEMVYRTALVYGNLRETTQRTLVRSSAYDGLDPSEKGAISYFLGLTMAKLFAGDLLSVPWLMHLDVYRQVLQPVLAGTSRPDLVGLTTAGQWAVMEAKGRTNGFIGSVLQDAKNQTLELTTIQGITPTLRVAALTYFDAAGRLEVAISDPRDEQKKLPDLPLTQELILNTYYRPLDSWMREVARVEKEILGNDPYRVANLPDVDISVGLPDRLPDLGGLESGLHVQRRGSADEFVGPDRLFVRLGSAWSPENMRLEPQERRRG